MEQLLMDVSDYSPVLPDSVTQLLLSRAGLDTESDPRVARIAALAAQKVSLDHPSRDRTPPNVTNMSRVPPCNLHVA